MWLLLDKITRHYVNSTIWTILEFLEFKINVLLFEGYKNSIYNVYVILLIVINSTLLLMIVLLDIPNFKIINRAKF